MEPVGDAPNGDGMNRRALRYRLFSLFALDMRDYMKCLHFAVGSLYKYCSVAGCATSNSSELAKVVDSFMLQKLGETAFQKFMDKNFKIFIKFEFEFHETIF